VIHSATLFQLCNTVIYGFQNQYPAPPATTGGNGSSALEILGSCSKGLFAQVNAGGYIPGAPAVTWGNLHNCRLTNFFPGNSASGPAYQTTLPLPNGDSNTIDQSDLLVNSSDTLAYGLTARSLRTYSLHGVDYLTPAKQGKNVRFINLAVSAGAATKAVTFSPGFSGGAIDFSSLTASNGAGTLPPATYYYLGTVTTPGGECRGLERSVVVSAPNDTVDLAIYGLVGATNYKLRIYRGTATGVYGGCYELPLNTGTYTDTNASFDIVGALPPGDGVNDNSMQEPDANYAVLVTPSWLTTHRVTSKATTGFTVDFGTAAPGGGGTIDIMMVR
jgi:hypothetical protein